mgnify:CR=1 FL=1
MRILIDACLPVQFKDQIPWENVKTTRELGWHKLNNGALLKIAEKEFDVLITMDKSIPNQQYLSKFRMGVIILRARTNRLMDLLPLVSEIINQLSNVKPGVSIVID